MKYEDMTKMVKNTGNQVVSLQYYQLGKRTFRGTNELHVSATGYMAAAPLQLFLEMPTQTKEYATLT